MNEPSQAMKATARPDDLTDEKLAEINAFFDAVMDQALENVVIHESTKREQVSMVNPVQQVCFRAGLLACREYMARFVEAESPSIAQSIRANWWPSLGDDPGAPRQLNFSEIADGGEEGPWTQRTDVSPSIEALPKAFQFLLPEMQAAVAENRARTNHLDKHTVLDFAQEIADLSRQYASLARQEPGAGEASAAAIGQREREGAAIPTADERERDGEFATFCRREGTTASRADSVSLSYRTTWNAAWKAALESQRQPSAASDALKTMHSEVVAAIQQGYHGDDLIARITRIMRPIASQGAGQAPVAALAADGAQGDRQA